jgi:hypothetical protein
MFQPAQLLTVNMCTEVEHRRLMTCLHRDISPHLELARRKIFVSSSKILDAVNDH